MKKVLLPLAFLAAAGGLLWYAAPRHEERAGLWFSGTVEADEVPLGFQAGGRIEELAVREGDRLRAGDLVARLEEQDLLNEVRRAEAALETARARLPVIEERIRTRREAVGREIEAAAAAVEAAAAARRQVEAGARPQELAQAQSAVDEAEAALENLRKERARTAQLVEAGALSQARLDAVEAQYLAAEARHRRAGEALDLAGAGAREEEREAASARLSLARAQAGLARAREGEVSALEGELAAARAVVAQAGTALRIARDRHGHARLVAPRDGWVTARHAEAGQVVAPGEPVVTIADLEHLRVKAFIGERHLGRLRVGQEAKVVSDTFPDAPYVGRVSFISPVAEFTPKNVQTREERVTLVYRFRIDLENPRQELKIGMPVEGTLRE